MAEPPAGDMIIAHFHHQLVLEGTHSLLRPVDQRLGPTGVAAEAWRAFEPFQLFGQRLCVFIGEIGRQADMVQLAVPILMTQQQQAHQL